MVQIACIGEVMIELASTSSADPEPKTLSFAGDTYNTALTLARLGIDCSYVTRLGDDLYSEAIVAHLRQEGIDTQCVTRQAGSLPGLYMIHNDADGERHFFYWRDRTPARQLFHNSEETARLETALTGTEMIYLSGITLAIIGPEGRANLLALLERLKQGGTRLAFDSNYRPKLWKSPQTAQRATKQFLGLTDIALLTLDDEDLLWEGKGDSIASLKRRYKNLPIAEFVLKRGPEDVVLIEGGQEQSVTVPKVTPIVDTTAAGDTFNAGYLAARLNGLSSHAAAEQANRCAGLIIQHRGGVIDREVFLSQWYGGPHAKTRV